MSSDIITVVAFLSISLNREQNQEMSCRIFVSLYTCPNSWFTGLHFIGDILKPQEPFNQLYFSDLHKA